MTARAPHWIAASKPGRLEGRSDALPGAALHGPSRGICFSHTRRSHRRVARCRVQLQAQRVCHLEDGSKARIALAGKGLVLASPIFYSFAEKDCQIELGWDTEAAGVPGRSRGYNLRLVRYVADCPLCGSKVSLRDGGFGWINRLVGCCDEEPGEHVFLLRSEASGGVLATWPRLISQSAHRNRAAVVCPLLSVVTLQPEPPVNVIS